MTTRFLQLILAQFNLLWPYWFGGLVIGALLKTTGAEQAITTMVNRNAHRRSVGAMVGVGALGGAVSPFCLFGAMPILGSLQASGIPNAALAAFLVASPFINPNLFVFSLALGWPMALLRLVSAIGLGLAAGALFMATNLSTPELRFSRKKRHLPERTLKGFFLELIDSAWFTGRYFVLGMALAAAVDLWVPKTLLMNLLGDANPVAILTGAFLGIPLYACGGGTIPLIRELMLLGVDPGVLMAFMLAGPATKVNNLTAIGAVGGRPWLVRFLVFTLAGSVAVGYLVHFVWIFIPR